jgi:beta-ureidopropionase
LTDKVKIRLIQAIVGGMDKRLIRELRDTWKFYRDRRPETYNEMTALLP